MFMKNIKYLMINALLVAGYMVAQELPINSDEKQIKETKEVRVQQELTPQDLFAQGLIVGNVELVKKGIELGADVNMFVNGAAPLFWAIQPIRIQENSQEIIGAHELLKVLLDAHVNLDVMVKIGEQEVRPMEFAQQYVVEAQRVFDEHQRRLTLPIETRFEGMDLEKFKDYDFEKGLQSAGALVSISQTCVQMLQEASTKQA
jgi:hypothetical protein